MIDGNLKNNVASTDLNGGVDNIFDDGFIME